MEVNSVLHSSHTAHIKNHQSTENFSMMRAKWTPTLYLPLVASWWDAGGGQAIAFTPTAVCQALAILHHTALSLLRVKGDLLYWEVLIFLLCFPLQVQQSVSHPDKPYRWREVGWGQRLVSTPGVWVPEPFLWSGLSVLPERRELPTCSLTAGRRAAPPPGNDKQFKFTGHKQIFWCIP